MTEYSTIHLAGAYIPLADLPDFKATMERGESKFKIVITCVALFTDSQIEACGIGETVTAGAGGVTFAGTVTGFGCRSGHSICQIGGAEVVEVA